MIYILKFDRPLGSQNPRGKAQFYLGFCEDGKLEARLNEHRRGTGAKITRAAKLRGIGFLVVATLPGDRSVERWLKSQKSTPRIVERLKRKGEAWQH